MQDLIDRPVIVATEGVGTYAGILRDYDTDSVTLAPARCLIKWREGHTYLDLAKSGPDKRDGAVSHQVDGPVMVVGVTLMAPLSDRACKAIVRVSEDNLAFPDPVEQGTNGAE